VGQLVAAPVAVVVYAREALKTLRKVLWSERFLRRRKDRRRRRRRRGMVEKIRKRCIYL
jgi:hypothetical protein